MLIKGKRFLLLIFVIIAMAGSLGALYEQILLKRSFSPNNITVSTLYTLCHHKIDNSNMNKLVRSDMTLKDLRHLFPSSEGWRYKVEGKEVIFTRIIEGLCNTCQQKTHLGVKGDYVAVIRGPSGVDGGVVRVTKVKLSGLPPELSSRLQTGKIDLPDEESLFGVLDSLDENYGN